MHLCLMPGRRGRHGAKDFSRPHYGGGAASGSGAHASGCSFDPLMNAKKMLSGLRVRIVGLSRCIYALCVRCKLADKYRFGPTGVLVGGHRELSLPQAKLSLSPSEVR
jgi:hypothetical protein